MKRLLVAMLVCGGLSIAAEAEGQSATLYQCSPAGCFPIRNAWRRCTGQPLLRRAYPVPQRVHYQPVHPAPVYNSVPAKPIRSAAPVAPAPQPAPQVERRRILNCPGGICRRW